MASSVQGNPPVAGALIDIDSWQGEQVSDCREVPTSGGGLESRATLVVSWLTRYWAGLEVTSDGPVIVPGEAGIGSHSN
jgi:hypothetical protein